jgi:predicted ATPase/class 3 adenylate cyclase
VESTVPAAKLRNVASEAHARSSAVVPPTGTVTFLFTDIEGSTQRWERSRDVMSAALARHDTIVRETIASRGGSVFKTVGDAFCAVFATAPDAIGAALDAQRALQAEDFSAIGGMRVRMALHTGTAEERDGDFFGPAVNRVARLLSIGHGGQVLVSHTTADLLEGEMPEQNGLKDLGAHRLKDLTRPEHVYQLIAPDLPEAFPALRSLGSFPNNLPPQLTSFVGRDEEVGEIKELLKDHRLVTLVGTGGAGKTRCAIQVGAELFDGFSDGVWLVELAPIADASLVPASVARVLGVREAPNRPLLDTLLGYLKPRQLLLVVDNCEHVIDEVRAVGAAILQGAPGVSILATSRESLSIAGERVFRLPSLSVPPRERVTTAKAALPYGAVALFADRAAAVDARFALTDENAPIVSEIVSRLDGIPLAIELAAARVNVLSPQQLVQKLNERFRVLTGGDRSALPRHRTMRALIDWSYDLLSDREQGFFRKLSIFAGGFTLSAASAVCGDDATDELAVLDVLSSLVDKSLVQSNPEGDQRYRLLESTRQYAREKLLESDEHPAVARRHAEAFLALAQRLEQAYNTTPDGVWFAQVEPELENWRAALDWALTGRADVLLGQRLVAALARVWAFLMAAEGLRWIRAAQQAADLATPPNIVGELDLAETQLNGVLGLQKASYAAAERALARYRNLGDPWGIAHAQRNAGRGLIFMGRISEGETLVREALAAFQKLGAPTLAGASLENLAIARSAAGDLAGARKFYGEALAIFKASGAERLAAAVATNLAEAEFRDGNALAALTLAQQALATDRAAIFTGRTAFLMCNIAAYLVALARYDEARMSAREGLTMARTLRYEVTVAWALQHLAAVAALRPNGDPAGARTDGERAARLLGYVNARLAALDTQRQYTEEMEHGAVLAALREGLGEEELARLMDEGRAWREDEATTQGMLV